MSLFRFLACGAARCHMDTLLSSKFVVTSSTAGQINLPLLLGEVWGRRRYEWGRTMEMWDSPTLPPTPENVRPRRHRGTKQTGLGVSLAASEVDGNQTHVPSSCV